jgi:subtilisin family serine protease
MRNGQKLTYILSAIVIFSSTVLTSNIEANAANSANIKSKNIDLVILFHDNSIDKNIENIVPNSAGEIINEFPDVGGIEVKCPSNLIPIIKSEDSVQSLAPNHVIKLSSNEKTKDVLEESSYNSSNTYSDLYEKYQWDIKRVTNNGESFSLESGNHDVVVGIIDSGVDTTHPDLTNNFLGGKNLVPANFENDSSETGDSDDVNDRLLEPLPQMAGQNG